MSRVTGHQTTGQVEAANFLAAHHDLLNFVRGCSDAEWATKVSIEERSVAVMADHMAAGYELIIGWIENALAGEPIPGTRGEQDMENARHADDRAGVPQREVLELLEATAPRVAAVLVAVPQEVAESDVHFGPAEGPLQVGRLMSLAAAHVTRHLGHVREALGRPLG